MLLSIGLIAAVILNFKGKGTARQLATTTQPQFPTNFTYFKQAACFQISRHTLRKLLFD
jgi:hypothetical protein